MKEFVPAIPAETAVDFSGRWFEDFYTPYWMFFPEYEQILIEGYCDGKSENI